MRPPILSPPDAVALRADLEGSGYTVEGVDELLGPVASRALDREQGVAARRVLRGRAEPVAVLLAAYSLGEAVLRRHLDAALPRLGSAGVVRCGLARAAGEGPDDEMRATCDLGPYAAEDAAGTVRWWLASDLSELATGGPLPPEHVLGVGGASTTLARITVRDPVERALDLGTGCGIQALHATRHADAVTATDLSPRALAYARFNASLAGADVALRQGSLFEPVRGEQFDLVVSNPPFVITPRSTHGAVPEYSYRDGGRSGDDLVRDLVVDVADVLAPGGVAQLLASWEHRAGEGWQDRVESWLAASGLDGWVIQREVTDPAEYAELWLRDGGWTPERDPGRWRAAYEAWLADFETRGVEAVGFGYVTLRRPRAGAVTLRRVEEQVGAVQEPLGEHIGDALRAHDWLAAHDDAALAAERFAVAGDVTEERYLAPGEPDPRIVLLRQGGGMGRVTQATTALAGVVGACDGELELGRLVSAVAALTEQPAESLAATVLPAVRELVRDGFLRRA